MCRISVLLVIFVSKWSYEMFSKDSTQISFSLSCDGWQSYEYVYIGFVKFLNYMLRKPYLETKTIYCTSLVTNKIIGNDKNGDNVQVKQVKGLRHY